MRRPLISALFFTCCLTAHTARADVAVIVAPANASPVLTQTQAAQIFLRKLATFPNGTEAMPVDQPEELGVRGQFYQYVVGKTHSQMSAYWSKMIFTGQGRPPAEIGDNERIKKFVISHPNAVGYIDKKAVDSSVRVLLVLP